MITCTPLRGKLESHKRYLLTRDGRLQMEFPSEPEIRKLFDRFCPEAKLHQRTPVTVTVSFPNNLDAVGRANIVQRLQRMVPVEA